MDDQNTDSDSHSVTSTQSVSSTSSKQKLATVKDLSASAKPAFSQSKRKQDEDGKVASTPKRKKIDGTDLSGTGGATPSSSSARKAAPLSERQQMALALAMSAQESGGTSPSQTSQRYTAADTTPRSAMLRKVNRKNEKGESPLHLATIKGDVAGMKRLLKAGADVNVSDYAGWTALHEACNHGFVDAAKLLLRKGANVNAQGLDNDTPLHDAAINGHPELVALLLKYGANAFQGNSKGQSPLNVALNDNISKLLRGETVFRLVDDESDLSASSPESTIPKEEEMTNIASGLETTLTTKPEPGAGLAGERVPSLSTDDFNKTDDEDSLDRTLVPEPEFVDDSDELGLAAAMTGGESDDTAATTSRASSAVAVSRPISTGFFKEGADAENSATDTKAVPLVLQKPDVLTLREPEFTKQTMIKEETSLAMPGDENTPAVQKTDIPKDDSSNVPRRHTVSDSSKSVRQSLDFKPIKVESTSFTGAAGSGISQPAATEPVKQEADSISDCKPADLEEKSNIDLQVPKYEPTTTSNAAEIGMLPKTESMKTEKPVPMDTGESAETKSVDIPMERETAQSPNPSIPTPVQDCATPEPTPATSPDSSTTDKTVKPFNSKVVPFAERKPVVEQVKNDTKSLSRPVSPAPEKAQRMRTGSMNRKRRQAQTPQPSTSTIDAPVQPEGDNSKDSTDSFMSSSSATRASRSRNKQQQNQQVPEEDPLPTRETRRKTMMKERAAANSPFADKTFAKSGGQKVPPLTIKLSGKAPVSSATPSTSSTASAVMAAGGEPYVMLQDKETERANSALAREQAKETGSPETQDGKDKEVAVTSAQASESTLSTPQSTATSSAPTSSGVSTRRTLRSHTNKNQGTVGEKLEDPVPPRKSKRMKTEPVAPTTSLPPSLPPPPGPLTIFNPYSLFKGVREQKNSSTNASKLAIPMLVAPSQLTSEMKELFNKQELERYKLRQQHLIEGEKLRIAYEQEILRVHTRGARAAANQETPLSVCTIMKDKESGTVYHPFNALKERMVSFDLYPWPFEDGAAGQSTADDKQQSERTSARSHFNNRQLISWLQDSDDKFDKLKDQMLSRHHHEAESLYAVQTMNWEWKLKELGLCDYKSQPTIDMLHVPMVLVNDEADILNSS